MAPDLMRKDATAAARRRVLLCVSPCTVRWHLDICVSE